MNDITRVHFGSLASLPASRDSRDGAHRALAIMGLVAASWLVSSASDAHAQDEDRAITSRAQQQVGAIFAAKGQLTAEQRKISSELLVGTESEQARALRQALSGDEPARATAVEREVLVDIEAEVSPELQRVIRDHGGEIFNAAPEYGTIRARVPTDQLEDIARSPEVKSIRRADRAMTQQAEPGEGVSAHAVDVARNHFGVDGTGVKVCALSDGVDQLQRLQSEGELPAVTVLENEAGSGSEGTAMLEIVHDLVPGAELMFATAFRSQASFAENIIRLGASGCNIIVDDVAYFREPVFQDGPIAQAVDQVVARGARYYSSAGNSGNLNDGTSGVWEGDFQAADETPAGDSAFHVFGQAMGNRVTQDAPFVFTLQWSDPWGASSNDYDLLLMDPNLERVLDSSTDVQDGDDDPFEQIESDRFNDEGNVLVIARGAGAEDRYLHLNTHRGCLEFGTAGQTSGHSAAEGAFSVAAVDVAVAEGAPFVGGESNPVEPFSSDGPRRIFYTADGVPLTPGDISSSGGAMRDKPDLAAADGVTTATQGFETFFGTSAAAPHAAAIDALLWQLASHLTPVEVRELYLRTALDIEASGADHDSGIGILMADRLLEAVQGDLKSRGEEQLFSQQNPKWSAPPRRLTDADRSPAAIPAVNRR